MVSTLMPMRGDLQRRAALAWLIIAGCSTEEAARPSPIAIAGPHPTTIAVIFDAAKHDDRAYEIVTRFGAARIDGARREVTVDGSGSTIVAAVRDDGNFALLDVVVAD